MSATEEQLAAHTRATVERAEAERELREAIDRAKAESPDALARVVAARLLRIECDLNGVVNAEPNGHNHLFAACAAVGKLRTLRRILRGKP